jgi:hypothetical protein
MKQQNKCTYSIWLLVLIVILTTLIVGAALKIMQNQQNPLPAQNGWVTYESQNGFSFQHPKGYGVNETIDPEDPENTIVHIVKLDENGEFAQVPPSLQINVSPGSVSFALWEGREWEGYTEIIGTFKFDGY